MYLQLLAVCGYHDNSYWEWFVTSAPQGPYQEMLCHVTFLIMCKNKVRYLHFVYAVIFEGCKFRGFRCTFAKRETFVLEKKQSLKETMYAPS